MINALYNAALLVETGTLAYLTGKVGFDWAWEKTVEFLCEKNIWGAPGFEEFFAALHGKQIV